MRNLFAGIGLERMAKSFRHGFAVVSALLCGALSAQEPTSPVAGAGPSNPTAAQVPGPAVPTAVVPFRSVAPTIDGNLEDWGGSEPEIRIGDSGQVCFSADAQSWGGEEDLSGSIRLAYDRVHLYVAGAVQDQTQSFAPSVANSGGGGATFDGVRIVLRPFQDSDEGRVDLVLRPFDPVQPWSFNETRVPLSGGADGQRVASPSSGFLVRSQRGNQEPSGLSYRFEARIPLHEFTFPAGTRALGFDLALLDRDDGDGLHAVMSWTGTDPESPSHQTGRLTLSGPGLLQPEPESSELGSTLLFFGGYVLLPLLLLGSLLMFLRVWNQVRRNRRRVYWALIVAGLLLLLFGTIGPFAAKARTESALESRLQRVVKLVREKLPQLEQGTLASYAGAARDEALTGLFAGQSIARQKYLTFKPLSDLGATFGPKPRRFPYEFFDVASYGIPLPVGRSETFRFPEPLSGEEVFVVVGRPLGSRNFSEGPEPTSAPTIRCELFRAGSKAEVTETADEPMPLVYNGIWERGDALGFSGFEIAFRPVALPYAVQGVALTTETGENLQLLGMTLVPESKETGVPLRLGQASRGGVQTDLRGPWPRDAGVELSKGDVRRFQIPDDVTEPWDVAWIFYRAHHPGDLAQILAEGTKVAEVALTFRLPPGAEGDPPSPVTLSFAHQRDMLFELARRNGQEAPTVDSDAEIAFTWEDESQERHLNLVRAFDIPDGALVDSIEFQSFANYPIRFRSVVFGSEKQRAPEDPPDSPLVRAGAGRRLDDAMVAELGDTEFAVFHGGLLTTGTFPAESRPERNKLPLSTVEALADPTGDGARWAAAADDGERLTHAAFVPLTGEAWEGAVLGVFVEDASFGQSQRSAHIIGLYLLLLAAPVILLLLSEWLSWIGNLRLRLMALLTVFPLAPLVVLSTLLLASIKSGHAATLDAGVRRDVAAAKDQLGEQAQALKVSAFEWLSESARLYEAGLLEGVAGEESMARFDAQLRNQLNGQLPPDWGGGYLELSWSPEVRDETEPVAESAPADATNVRKAFTVLVGDRRMAGADAPPRLEPSVFVHRGVPFLGVRADRPVSGGKLALAVGRPLSRELLASFAPGRAVLLVDARGYPLVASGTDSLEPDALLQAMTTPGAIRDAEDAKAAVLDDGKPVVRARELGSASYLFGFEVLRDLQGTPRAMVALVEPRPAATLDLPIGRVPVGTVFLTVGGFLVVLGLFLTYFVADRITRPLERLERGARDLSEGRFDHRVESEVSARGPVHQLTTSFNDMAGEVQSRMQDMHVLNRGIREMSTQLDLDEILHSVRVFCERHSAADRVRLVLTDPSGSVQVHGGDPVATITESHELAFAEFGGASGPFAQAFDQGSPWSDLVPGTRSFLALPMVVRNRSLGAIMLMFQNPTPLEVNLELFWTFASQAAVALQNGRLYVAAVQDPDTGLYAADWFRRQVFEAVARAQENGGEQSLLGFGTHRGGTPVAWREHCSAERARQLLEAAAVAIRGVVPRDAKLGLGSHGALCVLPARDSLASPRDLEPVLERVINRLQSVFMAHDPQLTIRGHAVRFPQDAASSEFLMDALQDGLGDVGVDGGREALAPAAAEGQVVPDPTTGPAAADLEGGRGVALAAIGMQVSSRAMHELVDTIQRVAPTELTIMLEGETGTGKEVLTNLIHRSSSRAGGPLVKVHCAALSQSLLTSELFGHEKGAFTGAATRKIGKFEQAAGGTLFLDEIGEIDADLQVKLLRVLQEREIDRVGGNRPIPVDVRILAATNRDMRQLVQEGAFREDLYYRLQGMVLFVPPLRERKQEIPQLVEHFRQEFARSGQSVADGFRVDAMDLLFRHDWPGNIRELRNTVQRALVFAADREVTAGDLAPLLGKPTRRPRGSEPRFVPTQVVDPVEAVPESELPAASTFPVLRSDRLAPTVGEDESGAPEVVSGSPASAASDRSGFTTEAASTAGITESQSGDAGPAIGEHGGVVSPSGSEVGSSSSIRQVAGGAPAPGAQEQPTTAPEVSPSGVGGAGGGGRSGGERHGFGPAQEALRRSVGPRADVLFGLLRGHAQIRTAEYVEAAGVSPRTALRDLNHLVDQGIVVRAGKRRAATYSLGSAKVSP